MNSACFWAVELFFHQSNPNRKIVGNIATPGCVSGDCITAVAMTEPGAGSDVAGMATTAVEDGDTVVLNGSKTFISNGVICDLVVPERQVSRHHARIRQESGRLVLEDLGSKNGTFVNGHQVAGPTPLINGDEIWIGRSVARMRFLIEGEPTKTETSVT